MMPAVEDAALDGRADAAQAADGVDGAQMVLVAVLDRQPRGPARRPGWCRRGPARCRGWPGRCRRRARRGSRRGSAGRRARRPPVWTMAGPSTARIFSPAARVRRMAAAISRTRHPLGLLAGDGAGHELEQVLAGGAVGREDAQPLPADDDRSPLRTSVIGMQRAGVALGIDEDAAVHLLVVHVDPVAVQADLGAVVGGAVEALGEGAVDVGRRRSRSPAAETGTAPWSWMASRTSRSFSGVSARTSMRA